MVKHKLSYLLTYLYTSTTNLNSMCCNVAFDGVLCKDVCCHVNCDDVLYRPSQPSVMPLTASLVPIPDDVVETSDDDDDGVDRVSATTHVSHQPRPFAVCLEMTYIYINSKNFCLLLVSLEHGSRRP